MLKPHAIKRALFMLVIMFPILLFAEFKGYNLAVWGAISGGITSGLSCVIFPDPEHLKRIKEQEKNENKNK